MTRVRRGEPVDERRATENADAAACSLIYCLSLDMIGGTEFGLGLTQDEYRKWMLAISKQLKRHWDALDFSGATLKFDGDGWRVFTPEHRRVRDLCCLGLLMVRRFQDDMASLTGQTRKNIPALRAAITSGLDLSLLLPNGECDWAGDSARRAVRAAGYCDGHTLLVSESVKQVVVRDFQLTPFDCFLAENSPKRNEEDETLYSVVNISAAVAMKAEDASASYVHVLRELGRAQEGGAIVEHLLRAATLSATDSVVQSNATRGVANLGSVTDAEFPKDLDLPRSTVAFNIAISAAPDYQTSLEWFERMEAARVTPDVVTFSTLVAKAPDYQTSLEWFERMEAARVTPDVVTFSTLFSKPLGDVDPQSIIRWYHHLDYHPEGPIGALLANLRRSRSIDGITAVLLHYPHLAAARKIMRDLGDEILVPLRAAYASAPNEPNPPYALGLCLIEAGWEAEAVPHLKHALKLARSEARKNHLRETLRQITQ